MTDRRQRQKELRATRKAEQRRAASRRELRRRITIALGIGLGLAGLLFVISYLTNRPTTLPASYLAFREQPTACEAEAPPEARLLSFDEPADQALGTDPLTVVIQTSCGPIEIELDPATYPETANSFVFLARQEFYDGTVFHRIASGFVIQGGDPAANGTGGPGYVLPDEFPPEGFVYQPGVVAMANAGARTTGSQFFIVVGEDARVLNNAFSILGRVVGGQETLDAITAVSTTMSPGSSERSRPNESVYIESIEIGA
jgi:cyclophilin family peptidyl-prolyl cis-trans isomerase